MLRSKRLENDVVVLFVNHRARPLVYFKIFSKPRGITTCPFTVNDTVSVFGVEFIIVSYTPPK